MEWILDVSISGFVHVLKTLEFLESDFKALKVLKIGFWSLKVLDFFIEQDWKISMLISFKLNESQWKQIFR